MEEYFDKHKIYEEAVNDVLNKKKSISEAAEHYGMSYGNLWYQINAFERSGKETYKYIEDKKKIFSHEEELLLLEQFNQEILPRSEYICTSCATERMREKAYQFVIKNNINCSWTEKRKKAPKNWLIGFENRHFIKISDSFPLKDCLLCQSSVNKSQPSSFDTENVSRLPGCSKDLQDDNSDTSSNCNKIFTQTTSETYTIFGYNQLEDPNEIIPEREEIIKEEAILSVSESDQPLDLRVVSKQRENS